MDLEDFNYGINRLQKFFKKKLDMDQESIWFEKLDKIPGKIFFKAIEDIIDSSKFFPTPGDFKIYWYSWQQTNPQKIFQEKHYCPDCQGDGVLYFTVPGQERPYEYMVRCGRCENWKGELGYWIPRVQLEVLKRKGYNIIQKITWDTSEENKVNINEMAQKALPNTVSDEVPF